MANFALLTFYNNFKLRRRMSLFFCRCKNALSLTSMSSHEAFMYSTWESLSQSQYNRINGGNILYPETNEQTHAVKHNALILDKKNNISQIQQWLIVSIANVQDVTCWSWWHVQFLKLSFSTFIKEFLNSSFDLIHGHRAERGALSSHLEVLKGQLTKK